MDGACFDAYLELCLRYKLPGQCADPHAYLTPADPTAAWAALRLGFDDAVLLAAGIAQRDVSGTLKLHPFLSAPSAPVVALRDVEGDQVNNLMTNHGCVAGYRYPLFAALLDKHSFEHFTEGGNALILTGTLEDAIALRSVGLVAVPIVGLSELDEYGLHLIGELFGLASPIDRAEQKNTPTIRSPDPQAAAQGIYPSPRPWILPGPAGMGQLADSFFTLTIARWSPASMSLAEPQPVYEAMQFLGKLKRLFHVDLFDVGGWRPTSDDIDRIKFSLGRRDARRLRKSLLQSLEDSSRDLESLFEKKSSPPDRATASHDLQQAFLHNATDSESLKRRTAAVAEYEAAMEREIFTPLMRQNASITNESERARHLRWVDLYRVFCGQMLVVREQTLSARHSIHRNVESGSKKDPTTKLLNIHKQLLALEREIKKCFKTRKPLRTQNTATVPTKTKNTATMHAAAKNTATMHTTPEDTTAENVATIHTTHGHPRPYGTLACATKS